MRKMLRRLQSYDLSSRNRYVCSPNRYGRHGSTGSTVTLDDEFGRDLTDFINSPS